MDTQITVSLKDLRKSQDHIDEMQKTIEILVSACRLARQMSIEVGEKDIEAVLSGAINKEKAKPKGQADE